MTWLNQEGCIGFKTFSQISLSSSSFKNTLYFKTKMQYTYSSINLYEHRGTFLQISFILIDLVLFRFSFVFSFKSVVITSNNILIISFYFFQIRIIVKIDRTLDKNTNKEDKTRERFHKRIYIGSDSLVLHSVSVIRS